MKKSLRISLFVSLIVTLSAFTVPDPGHAQAKKRAFTKGESLKFTVSYGFLNAAEAVMEVAPEVKRFNERPVYKIDVTGQTLGIFKLFKVNDTWGTYLDTARLIPYHSYRFLEEGKYRKNERVYFDQQKGKAEMKLFDREDAKIIDTKTFDIPQQVQDIVSGFYYLRSMDLRRHKPGDIITINGFFDKQTYAIKLIYEGKETLKTKLGTYETMLFTPVMPPNKLFKGEYPVTVWISDDENKIPLKIKAKLVVGALNMDLVEASGIRNK